MATTDAKASDNQATLEKLEQAVKAEAAKDETVSEEKPKKEETAPDKGQAYEALAKKKGFSSADDLAKAYQALESRFTRTEQSSRDLEQKMTDLQSKQEKGKLSNQEEQALKILEDTVARVIDKKLRPIQDTLGVQRVDRMIEDMQGQHPEFKGAVVDEVMDYMLANKGVTMEQAFKILNYDNRKTVIKKEETKQQKKRDSSRAFAESAGSARTGDNIDYSKLSLEELEDILPSAGQFIDSKGKMRRG